MIAPSGEQHELVFENQRAVVVEVGGGLRTYDGVLDGYAADEMCASGRGQVLVPWPNRLEEGAYEFDGKEYQLALSEPKSRTAIHGLVRSANWNAVEREPARVLMEYVLHPQSGYPFTLRIRVEYPLGADGLSVRTTAENLGDRPCPFGVGHYPYIAAPTGRVDDLALDGELLGSKQFDDTFAVEAPWRLRVGEVTVWADAAWRWRQLFTGDAKPDVARRSLAVEPMTCPPNAFRTGECLIRLEPGDVFAGSWGISR